MSKEKELMIGRLWVGALFVLWIVLEVTGWGSCDPFRLVR